MKPSRDGDQINLVDFQLFDVYQFRAFLPETEQRILDGLLSTYYEKIEQSFNEVFCGFRAPDRNFVILSIFVILLRKYSDLIETKSPGTFVFKTVTGCVLAYYETGGLDTASLKILIAAMKPYK